MKKLILLLFVFFNAGIAINNHQIILSVGSSVYAQRQGEIRCPSDPGGNGTNSNWWTTFTTWINDLNLDMSSSLGEQYTDGIGGVQPYVIGGYPWGSGVPPPYIDFYYDGVGGGCYETPSIYGGPYRGGLMFNCTDGLFEYIDCAFTHHSANESGISGTTDDIAYLDECNECVGGSTGLPPCSSPLYFTKLQNGDSTKYYDGDTITVGPSGSFLNPMQITLYNEHGVPPPSLGWISTCNSSFMSGWYSASSNSVLNLTNVGNYTITVNSGNLLSNSTILTNYLNVIRTDTVKAIKVICDSLKNARDAETTKIVDSLDKLPEMQLLRTKVHDTVETALSAYDSSGNYRIFPNPYSGTANYGSSSAVTFDTTTGANHKRIVIMAHTHTDSANALPDNNDIYMLLFRRLGIFLPKNRFFNHSLIVSGQAGTDLDILVTDTMAALQFINLYPRDSTVDMLDTLIISYPTSPVTYDTLLLNPAWSNYKGPFGADSLSMKQEFDNATRILERNNYPKELVWTYAQIYMIQRYNMGVRVSIKEGGQFKELAPVITRDSTTGALIDLKINICQ